MNGAQPRTPRARVSVLAFAACFCGTLVATAPVSQAEESIETLASGKYVYGTTRDIMASAGDLIHLRMRATAVYRSFILSIESTDGAVFVPFATDDFRYLGEGRNAEQTASDQEEILRIAARPERGGPDPEMADAWRKMPISESAIASSEWVKCGPGNEWHHYAVVIRPEMLKTTELPNGSR